MALALCAMAGSALGSGGTHEHGVLRMDVALTGDLVEILLEGPGETFVAFEHTARTSREQETVRLASRRLLDAGALLKPDSAAACGVQFASVSPAFHRAVELKEAEASLQPVDPHGNHDDAEPRTSRTRHLDSLAAHAKEDHASEAAPHASDSHADDRSALKGEHEASQHSDWTLRYRFQCQRVDLLTSIDVLLFERFPGVRQIRAQVVTPTLQFGVVLDPGNRQLDLRPTP